MNEQLRLDTLAAWNHYQTTGLYATGEEVDAWLTKLAAGEDAEVPECHVEWHSPEQAGQIPNRATLEAMEAGERGEVSRATSVAAMLAELNAHE